MCPGFLTIPLNPLRITNAITNLALIACIVILSTTNHSYWRRAWIAFALPQKYFKWRFFKICREGKSNFHAYWIFTCSLRRWAWLRSNLSIPLYFKSALSLIYFLIPYKLIATTNSLTKLFLKCATFLILTI